MQTFPLRESGMGSNGKYCVEIAFEQIYSISRLVGTFPLDHNNKLSWGLLIFCTDFIFNLYALQIDLSKSKSNFHACLTLLRSVVILPACFVNFGCLYFKIERLLNLFKELLEFEQYSHRIGVTWNYEYKWWNKYLSLLVAMNSIGCWFYNFSWETVIRITLRRIHVYIVLYTIVDQITGTTSLLASAIAHLKYIRDDRELLRKFEKLVFLCRTVEDYFGPQIVAITAWSFVSLVAVTFWYAVSTMNAFQTVCIFVLTAFPLMVIYIPFLSIVYQARKIEKLLYRRLLANPNDEMLEFHMIAKRNVSFTALGFFRIKKSLFGSMIGAGTTYLVILLQYGK